LNKLMDERIIAVIRGVTEKCFDGLISTLIESNIHILEVTVDTPGVYEKIEKIKVRFGNKVVIGAGTVLDSETAQNAINSGAEFLVSPILDLDVIKIANRYEVMVIPGCMTPT